MIAELGLEPAEHPSTAALAESRHLGVAHEHDGQEVRGDGGGAVLAQQTAVRLVDQVKVEISGKAHVVIDLDDEPVSRRGVPHAGEVRLLGRNLPARDRELRRRGDSVVCSAKPSPIGPLRSRTRARLAARALRADEVDDPARALPRLRARLRELAECRRFEDAARLRDRLAAVEDVVRAVQRIERARRTRCCVIVPSSEPGYARGIFVANGRIADVRTLGSRLEVEAGLAAAELPGNEDLDELLLIGTFLRRPPPELRVAPLRREAILRVRDAVVG